MLKSKRWSLELKHPMKHIPEIQCFINILNNYARPLKITIGNSTGVFYI